jgi:chromosome segregation ATPase
MGREKEGGEMMSDEIAASLHAQIAELRAQLANRDALIARVTKTLGGYSDSNLLSLATTVAIGYQQWSDGHDAQVEALRAQITERGMELVIKEMRIESLLAALDDMRNRWKSAENDWMQLRAQVATLTERLARCTCTDDYGNEAP